ncbi:MAG: TolC family protein [Acidobacteriota bacterium]|nr:TolC family protein [Acidobacteriota bacterium]
MSKQRCNWVQAAGLLPLGLILTATALRAEQPAELPAAPEPARASLTQARTGLAAQYAGLVTVQAETSEPLALTLDDAITRALDHNLQVRLAKDNERAVHGQVLNVGNSLLPNLTARASSTAEELNLAAMGFKPASLAGFGFPPGTVKTIVKINTTSAQLSASQALFNIPAFYLVKAAFRAEDGAKLTTLNARGVVVQGVATTYLGALADQAQVQNARALAVADEEVLRQAKASHDAGVGTNLDVLRAQVQLQAQQQAVVRAENAFAKDKIQLNRLMGLPAGQELSLTDSAPYAEFVGLPHDQALALAYQRRKDLLSLQAQLEVAEATRKAIRYERAPSLSFDGYYGVLGETTGLYHGVFNAEGKLSVPLFREAAQRGEIEVANAQVNALRQHIVSLKVTIDEQIRSSMLDVASAGEMVKVAQSSVELAQAAMSDARDRFAAGVDDNLAVVEAQAQVADAETRLVQTLYRFNAAKLALARNTGVVETQYKSYLGR